MPVAETGSAAVPVDFSIHVVHFSHSRQLNTADFNRNYIHPPTKRRSEPGKGCPFVRLPFFTSACSDVDASTWLMTAVLVTCKWR